MKKNRFQVVVAISVAIFFLTVTVTHACIGTMNQRGAHGCAGVEVGAARLQASHTEAQDVTCTSVRDRFVSVAFALSQTHSWFGDLHVIPVIGEQLVAEIQTLTAERPPGSGSVVDDQPPLYIFNSVFRI